MCDVGLAAREEVINTEDVMARRQESVAEVRAKESRASRHQDLLRHFVTLDWRLNDAHYLGTIAPFPLRRYLEAGAESLKGTMKNAPRRYNWI